MTPENVNAVALALFVVGVLVGFVSTVFRLVRLRRAGIALPRLIRRDALVFGGLAIAFVALGVHRVAGLPFADEVWWAMAIGSVAVAAVWIYVYYELLVIGHRRDGPDRNGE